MMDYVLQRHNKSTVYIGQFSCDYYKLVKVIGVQTSEVSGDGKVQCSWDIKFEGENYATIWSWKYYGKKCQDVENWSVGVLGIDAQYMLFQLLEEKIF